MPPVSHIMRMRGVTGGKHNENLYSEESLFAESIKVSKSLFEYSFVGGISDMHHLSDFNITLSTPYLHQKRYVDRIFKQTLSKLPKILTY